MKQKAGKVLRRLDRRLMFFISLAVIPINVLAILMSQVAIREAQERIAVSYETEFEIFMGRKLDLLDIMDQWFNGLVAENQRSFLIPDGFDEVNSIALVNHGRETFDMYGWKGFFFLAENDGAGKAYLGASAGLYPTGQNQALKAELKKLGERQIDWRKWELKKLAGRYFFLSYHSYRNYEVAFALDLGAELEEWLQSEYMEACGIILSDSGMNICFLPGEIRQLEEEERIAYQEGKQGNWKLSGAVRRERGGIEAALFHDGRWARMPVSYGVLQLIAWLGLVILVFLWFLIRRQAVSPLQHLAYAMKQLEQEQWGYRIGEQAATEEYEYVYQEFNRMADEILTAREQEKQLYETRMNNLKLQVNPHLLLNSLNMIYSLAETRQYQVIQKYTMNLVEYFRYCLRENNDLVCLSSEMRFVENYLDIQKIRYPGLLSGVYYMEDGLEESLLPPLLIQNFVENAVKYARRAQEAIEILIYIRQEGGRLFISVNDTGVGIEEALVTQLNQGRIYEDKDGRKHIGIYNCRKRLELFYGADASLKITSEKGEGTQVWIELPYSAKRKET